MATWFEDLEVTRFIKLRNPPSVEAEKEFLERMARDANAVFWVVEHEGNLVGATSIVAIDWKHGFGTTGTVIGDKTAWEQLGPAPSCRVHPPRRPFRSR